MKTAQGTCRDLAACFTSKQVEIEFSSLSSRLVEAWLGRCTWHHHGGRVEVKRKTVDSMASGVAQPSRTIVFLLAHRGILAF
jgi:hypothetical protein